jgi:hypothetical protein
MIFSLVLCYKYNVGQIIHNAVEARGKKPPIRDTSKGYHSQEVSWPLAAQPAWRVYGERKEFVLED